MAFSFPLCGGPQPDWTLANAMKFMHAQITAFSLHLGELECAESISCFWDLARFMVVPGSSEATEWHIVMYLVVDSRLTPCYVYIHEDEIS